MSEPAKVCGFTPGVATQLLDNLDASGRRTVNGPKPLRAIGFLIVQTTTACTARAAFADALTEGTAKLVRIGADKKLVIDTETLTYLNLGVGTNSNIAANTILMLAREELSNQLLANWEACP
jgi:hypothetical protein